MSVEVYKRLTQPSGEVSENSAKESDSEDRIVRKAILVHAGPNGEEVEFTTGDGSGIKFDAARIKNVVDVHNKYVDWLAKEYGGEDKIPEGAWPPLLDLHESAESTDRVIGRLTGRLKYVDMDVPKVGKNVPCAIAEPGITFLGKHTVSKVKDGRIYHLSVSISESTDRLGELSAVIEPAAPGAMLLNGAKTHTKGDTQMSDKLKRMKAHTERMAKLSSIKSMVDESQKKLVGASDMVKLTKKKDSILKRLNGLMSSRKLSPAEYKKLDLVKLSGLSDDALEMVLATYDGRQPVIEAGLRGSSSASDFTDMARHMGDTELKKLRGEIAKDFKKLGKEIPGQEEKKDMAGGNKETPVTPGKDEHVVPGQEGDEKLKAHLDAMSKHLEAGDMEKAKEAHKAMAAYCSGMQNMSGFGAGDVKSEDSQKSFEHMQSQVDELNTQMARMAGALHELIGDEESEGKDIEKGEVGGGKEPGAA